MSIKRAYPIKFTLLVLLSLMMMILSMVIYNNENSSNYEKAIANNNLIMLNIKTNQLIKGNFYKYENNVSLKDDLQPSDYFVEL